MPVRFFCFFFFSRYLFFFLCVLIRCPWGWCNGDSALHESRCLYSKMRWGVSWGWAYEKKETGELDFDRLRTAEEVEEDEKGWTILDADETDSREMIVDSDDDKV